MPVLVLDDLGAESSTPWAEEKLYQIIVYRYETPLPTIITTSFGMEQLERAKPRLASRLMDTMIVEWCPINAPDYRTQRNPNPPSRR